MVGMQAVYSSLFSKEVNVGTTA